MRTGRKILQSLYAETPRGVESVDYGGVKIKRLLLRKGAKYYTLAIDRYLIDKLLNKIEKHLSSGASWSDIISQLKSDSKNRHPEKWVDIAGLLALDEKVEKVVKNVVNGQIRSINALTTVFRNIYDDYDQDEWAYIGFAFEAEYGIVPHKLGKEKAVELIDKWGEAASSLNALTLADAKIEFADFSQIGYGLYGDEEQKAADFKAVRGSLETNAVIKQCEQETDRIKARVERLKTYLE